MKDINTLREFLNYFEFDYIISDDGLLCLVDDTGANLGDIESERYTNDTKGVESIIDRLDAYYKDYVFDDLADRLERKFKIDTSKMQWRDLYEKVKELNLEEEIEILKIIFGDKKLEVEEFEK